MLSKSDKDGFCEVYRRHGKVYSRHSFCKLVEGCKENKWARKICRSCYRRQKSWIYPLKTVWNCNKSWKSNRWDTGQVYGYHLCKHHPHKYRILEWTKNQQIIDETVYNQRLMQNAIRKLVGNPKNIAVDCDMKIDKRTGEVLCPEVDYTCNKEKLLSTLQSLCTIKSYVVRWRCFILAPSISEEFPIFCKNSFLSFFLLYSSNFSRCCFVICLILVLAWFIISGLSLRYFSIPCNTLWNSIDEVPQSYIACGIILAMLLNLISASSLIASCYSCFMITILKDFCVTAVARKKPRLILFNTIPTRRPTPIANKVMGIPPVITFDVIRPISTVLRLY